jgi:hypothetical protein
MGKAIPYQIRQHVHPNAVNKNTEPDTKAKPTRINYLNIMHADLQSDRSKKIAYANLPPAQPKPAAEPDPPTKPEASAEPGGTAKQQSTDSVGAQLPGQLDLSDLVDPDHEGGRSK